MYKNPAHKYGVLYEESIYVPAEHGYPAHTDTFEKLQKFQSEEDLLEWIKRNQNKEFTVIRYEELKVEVSFSLK